MATAKEKAAQKLRDDERSKRIIDLSMKLSRKDWQEAREEIGIVKTEADDDETTIMLAKKAAPSKSYTELNEMGSRELGQIVFGDLAPTDDEIAQQLKEATE